MDPKLEYKAGQDPEAAAALARRSDVAIVFVNQPTSEWQDVPSLSLPDNQDQLVSAVAAVNPHTIVVLETGDPVVMPRVDKVSAVLEAWYPGIRGAEAIANILFGDVDPSGKRPVTFPGAEADLPHAKLTQQPPPAGDADMVSSFPGGLFRMNTRRFEVDYNKGLKVGYKWYDAEGKQPLFPFGYGLSYTTYSYSDLRVTQGQGQAVISARSAPLTRQPARRRLYVVGCRNLDHNVI
jgi:beta-glucosidase